MEKDKKPVFVDEVSFINKRDEVLLELEGEFGWIGRKLKDNDDAIPNFDYKPIPSNMPVAEKAAAKAYNDQMKTMADQWNNNRSKLFNQILKMCSEYCRYKIQRDPEYQQARQESNPMKLWKIISRILIPTAENQTSKFKSERERLKTIKQGDLHYKDYIAEFEKQLKIYQEVGGKVDGYDIFETFLQGLNPVKHAKSIEKIQVKQIRTYYEARDKLQELETAWEAVTIGVKSDQTKQPQQVNFVESRQSSKNKRLRTSDEEGTTKKIRFNKPSKFFKRKRNFNTKGDKKKICEHCYKKNLPDRVYKSHDTAECTRKSFRKPEKVNMITHGQSHEPEPEFSNMVFIGVVNSGGTSSKAALILDTGATINTYNKEMPLKEILDCKVKYNFFKGHSQYANNVGISEEWLEGIYEPDSSVNILSMNRILKFCEVRYDHNQDSFTITNKRSGKAYQTHKTGNGLYQLVETQQSVNLIVKDQGTTGIFHRLDQSEQARIKRVRKLHEVLDHPYTPALIKSIQAGSFASWEITPMDIKKAELENCIECKMGKMDNRKTEVMEKKYEPVPEIGEFQHADIVVVTASKNKKALFLVSVDEISKFTFVKQLQTKKYEEIAAACLESAGYMKSREVTFHTDRESTITKAGDVLLRHGIRLRQTPPYVHERFVEREVRTIRNGFRSTLLGLPYRLPKRLYPFLFIHVVMSQNMVSSTSNSRSPWELIHGRINDGFYLKHKFGQLGLFHNRNPESKDAPKADIGIYIGKEYESSSVKCFLFGGQNPIIADRDKMIEIEMTQEAINYLNALADADPEVSFEQALTMLRPGAIPATPLYENGRDPLIEVENEETTYNHLLSAPSHPQKGVETVAPDHLGKKPVDGQNANEPTTAQQNGLAPVLGVLNKSLCDQKGFTFCARSADDTYPESYVPMSARNESRREGTYSVDESQQGAEVVRQTIGSAYSVSRETGMVRRTSASVSDGGPQEQLDDRKHKDTKEIQATSSIHEGDSGVEGVYAGTRKRKIDYQVLAGLKRSKTTTPFISMITESQKEEEIEKAERKEIEQILKLKVWTPLLQDQIDQEKASKAIPAKIFTIEKLDALGNLVKIKSRLVAGGHREYLQPEVDTSSPTVRLETVFMIVNIALSRNLILNTMDIAGAFLEAKIGGEVYVSLNEKITPIITKLDNSYTKYINPKTGKILVKLNKALYGCKEASMEWYQHSKTKLLNYGLKMSSYDPGMFYTPGEIKLIVLSHVDDLLITGSAEEISKFKAYMEASFGKITFDGNREEIQYIGMIFRRYQNRYEISQPGYLNDIIKKFKLNSEDVATSPATEKLMEEPEIDEHVNASEYRSNLMTLMFITRTRPDIKFPVMYLSTKMKDPRKSHEQKLTRIAQYLNGTKKLALTFTKSNLQLYCSADASYASHSDRKSQTGVLITLGTRNGPIMAISRKQTNVAKSSTEAEIVALNLGGEEVIPLKRMLDELGIKQSTIQIEQDNQSAIIIATRGSGRTRRSRFMEIQYFWITEQIEKKLVELVYKPSSILKSDGLTKALNGTQFVRWRDNILNSIIN